MENIPKIEANLQNTFDMKSRLDLDLSFFVA